MVREEEVSSDTLRWIIDNPARRNAIGPEGLDWIATRAPQLSGQVVMLTGAGTDSFCAGFDLTRLAKAQEDALPDAPLVRATAAMLAADATFVAVAHGHVIGAGVELACACDLRIVADDAAFAVPAARLGVIYHAAGLSRMHAVLGPWVTTRLILLGERVSAGEAAASGALLRIVPSDQVAIETERVVQTLQASPSPVLAGHRDLLRRLGTTGLDREFLRRYEGRRAQAYAALSPPRPGPGSSRPTD